jgi:tRNA-splicing ligase RtcB (3'-phosphate/5'-hydroxy nucleic acid ligase)
MEGKVWLADRAEALLDEIPSAYKDIDRVMADQTDLVEVLHTLHQVLNYKGV